MKNSPLKTLLIGLAFVLGLVVCFFLFSQGENVIHNQKEQFVIQKELDNRVAFPILDAINSRNSQIRNISCSLKAIAQMPGKRAAKLNGFLSYEKDRKFRMELDSFLGPEIDIGSDGTRFWFWSGRMKRPGLYWSTYENFHKTRLKTPFNPEWLSHCLGIDTIDYQSAVIDQSDNRWRVIIKTKNAKGEPVTAVSYVDSSRGLITGHGVYDQNGTLEASSEIEEFNGILPAKITFIWHKETASMVWYLENIQANTIIDSHKWMMPNISPKIDMGHDF